MIHPGKRFFGGECSLLDARYKEVKYEKSCGSVNLLQKLSYEAAFSIVSSFRSIMAIKSNQMIYFAMKIWLRSEDLKSS